MEKLKMHTPDIAEENFRKLAQMFPNAITETVNENGEVVRAIDADILRQEISCALQEAAKDVPLKVGSCVRLTPEKAGILYALLYEILGEGIEV